MIWARGGSHGVDAEAQQEDQPERRQDDHPFQRAHEQRVAERRQVHAGTDLRRDLGAAAQHLGRRGGIAGHRQHVDAERGEAGDGQPEHHVIVDAQHVGPQACSTTAASARVSGRPYSAVVTLRSKSDMVETSCVSLYAARGCRPAFGQWAEYEPRSLAATRPAVSQGGGNVTKTLTSIASAARSRDGMSQIPGLSGPLAHGAKPTSVADPRRGLQISQHRRRLLAERREGADQPEQQRHGERHEARRAAPVRAARRNGSSSPR